MKIKKGLRAKRRPRGESLPVIPPGKLSLMSKLRCRQELFEIKENRGEKIEKRDKISENKFESQKRKRAE